MTDFAFDVRRHNGQCSYGPWLDVTDDDLPYDLREAVFVAARRGGSAGTVEFGGQHWAWRRTEPCVAG